MDLRFCLILSYVTWILQIYEVPMSVNWHSDKGIGFVSDMYSWIIT